MTNLSKQLGEIKRRHERDVFRSPCPEKAHNDRAALLNIIEVQIPGKLRADAAAHEHRVEPNESRFAEGLRAAALYIESLTNEKEKG